MFIRWLLNHLLFAGTSFFAAGAVPVGGGGATSPTGGNASTVDSGGGKVIPSGSGAGDGTSSTVGDTDAKGGVAEDLAADDFGDFGNFDTADDVVTQAVGSGEEFGPETYKTVKEALKDKPEVFKEVKKAVSMVKRYMEHFETPEKAGELLSDIQTHGGWDAVKQEIGETATFLNGWNAGDSAVVNAWLDDNADGLAKNMPTVVEHWQKTDPQGWAHDAAGTFMATMLQPDPDTGLSPIAALNQLGQMEGVKDSPAFKTLMQRIQGVKATADKAPIKAPAKPADDTKLNAREQRVQQQEANLQRQALAGKAAPILKTSAENALKIVAGTRKLSPQAKTDLLNDIQGGFARLAAKDQDGVDKRKKLLAAGQHDQWLKMSKALAERLMPTAARRVWRKYAGISGMSAEQKKERKAEAQGNREAGAGATTTGAAEKKSPGEGRSVDWGAMAAKFGGRDKASDVFLYGPNRNGQRIWIEKGTGKEYTY